MFPLPMLSTTPIDLESIDSRQALPYHLAFMKNTILRAFNNIHVQARQLRPEDSRLGAFLEYVMGTCDVVALHVLTDERLFRIPVIAGVALEKLLDPECVQDMRRVLDGAERLQKLARKYSKHPEEYDGRKITGYLSFCEEFAARAWVQVRAVDPSRLVGTYSEADMRRGLKQITDWFVCQSDPAFLVPFIYSHHDRETSQSWPKVSHASRITLPCLAKKYAKSWELAPFDVSTGKRRESRENTFEHSSPLSSTHSRSTN
ncbi:hypothetical protein BC834DRAFT_641529 [Gloeopeniophorella convolvens]|nr:hypothetical protein BC834DRAFT_641529 [Gloeopeniophorella convolvens]